MNEDEVEKAKWRCSYCAYENGINQPRCLICCKLSTKKIGNDYPKFVSEDVDDIRFFKADNIPIGNVEEELENVDRADRDNLILKIAEEEHLSLAQAELVANLMDLDYDRESAVDAARQCSTFETAKAFLSRHCPICECLHPESKMESMYYCEHSCCILCTKQYFTIQVREKNLVDIVCPVCSLPAIGETIMLQDYFARIDSQFKRIVDADVYELLQTKLRDHSLKNDPEFFWCNNCKDYGFCTDSQLATFKCPLCRISYCAKCRNPWDSGHYCFAKKEHHKTSYKNDLYRFINHSCIQCPKCKTEYSLARGGCMHFTCSNCKFDWCASCHQPFLQGKSCNISEACKRRGLHAHHPRNCFYFGRDRNYKTMQQLLINYRVPFETKPLADSNGLCSVLETSSGSFTEVVCAKKTEDGQGGLCSNHYREYLSMIIFQSGIDPVDVMDTYELIAELNRNDIDVPIKKINETDEKYHERLKQVSDIFIIILD
ncbi:hypothetical protein CHUAL_000846 [Chamberlinius hualienensis]